MKKFYLYFQLLLASVFLASCSNDEDSFDNSYIGNWKGQMEVYYSDTDDLAGIMTVEYSLSKNGRFEQKFSGMKFDDEAKGDGYTLNRGSYTVENDTIWLQFDYEEKKGDSNDDIGPYVDKKESDGNWYRYNLDDDGENWQVYSEVYGTSPKFVEVSKNKYKHIYLYGEDKWIHQGKVIWKMSTRNELAIFDANNVLMYKLYRK